MSPVAKPTKAPVKKAAKPLPSQARMVVEATRAFLLKTMKQKPIVHSLSQLPHIPSGSLVLDNLIGGSMAQDGKARNCPGYPRRRIIEIFGPEASGKTTAALSAIVQCQRAGGVAMFIDMEHALHYGYAKRLGVDFDNLLLYAPDSMEECFQTILGGVMNGVDIIVLDSVAALVPSGELVKSLNDEGGVGLVARRMSRDLPKFVAWLDKYPVDAKGEKRTDHDGTCLIMLNQTRDKINMGGPPGRKGGPQESTPGGRALKFYAYLRLRFQGIQREKVERINPVTGKKQKYEFGSITLSKIVKNKVDATNGSEGYIFIRYGFGIDDLYSLIECGVTQGIIKREGAFYTYNNERVQGRDKLRQRINGDMALRADLEKKVTAALVQIANPILVEVEEETEEERVQREQMAEMAALGGGIVVEKDDDDFDIPGSDSESDSDSEDETVDTDDDVPTPEEVDESA